ncbi:MAG TPA: zinc ribbon domain-containing protein [Anaerolineae bacterium]|nr:zinc ribbon domain-containing protein [Anaerolineae bacterium]
MPIYEYQCQKCGATFEKFVRSSSAQIELRCPECGSEEVRKVFSLFATSGFSSSRLGSATSEACRPAG